MMYSSSSSSSRDADFLNSIKMFIKVGFYLWTKFIIDVRLLRFLLVVNWTSILISTSEAFAPSVSTSSISSASFLISVTIVRFQLGALVCIELSQRFLRLRVLVVGSTALLS